jgi:hypothetical protein
LEILIYGPTLVGENQSTEKIVDFVSAIVKVDI